LAVDFARICRRLADRGMVRDDRNAGCIIIDDLRDLARMCATSTIVTPMS
jgi:hypothetical protein